ncbi:MAG TPA: hypothetical protein VHN16_09250 [Streptosporangiaceae bacterium]|nr:hypothetical protein [Streptosporangiaceae bacterium]
MSSLPDIVDRYRQERAFQIAEISERQRDHLLKVLGDQSAQGAELAQSARRLAGATQDIAAEISRMAAVADWAFPAIVEHLALTAERLGGVEQMLANPAETAAAEFYRNGTYALANGWWEDAVADLSEAVQRYKYNPRTWFNLGVAQQRTNFTTAAAESYRRCAQYGASVEPALAARAALLAAFNYRAAMQADASAKILRAYAEKVDRCAELHLALGVHHQDHDHLVKALLLTPNMAVDAGVGKTSGLEEAAAVVCQMAGGPVHRLRAIEQAMVLLVDVACHAGLDIAHTAPVPVNLPAEGVDALLLAHNAIPEAAEQVNRLGLEIRNEHEQSVRAAAVATQQADIARAGTVMAAHAVQAMESSARALGEEVAQADAMVHASSLSQGQGSARQAWEARDRAREAAVLAQDTAKQARDTAKQARDTMKQAREAANQALDAAVHAQGRAVPASVDSDRAAARMVDLREELNRADEILTYVTKACHSAELHTGDDWQRTYSVECTARQHGESGKEVQTGGWAPVHVQLEVIEQQVKLQAWQQSIEAQQEENPSLAAIMQRLESATEAFRRANFEQRAFEDRPSKPSLWGGERKRRKEIDALADAVRRAEETREQADEDCSLSETDAYGVTVEAWAAGSTRAWRQAVAQAVQRKAQLAADVKLAEREYEQAAELHAEEVARRAEEEVARRAEEVARRAEAIRHAEEAARHAEEVARWAEEAAQQARHQIGQAKQQARERAQQINQAARKAAEHERRSQDAWQDVTRLARNWHAPDEAERLTVNIRSRLVSNGDGAYGRVEAEREFWALLRDPARQRAQKTQEESEAAMRVAEEAAAKVRDALTARSAAESIVEASRHAAARPARIIPFDLPGEWSDLES